ncbi:hypothetical protein GCM10010349_68460 [Streptomyces flavofungini]|nr:hypothetical protein GCM10010349_68460 [Streptomyces flavofungini]
MSAAALPSVLRLRPQCRSFADGRRLPHAPCGRRVQVRSAGSAPADNVNPAVVEAMAEVGIDVSAEIPKMLTAEAVQAADVVITMGCGDICETFQSCGTPILRRRAGTPQRACGGWEFRGARREG